MKFKKILRELPILPTTALIFYLIIFVLWNINLIPSPTEIVHFLENLYLNYGLFGLAIATFLEGIVYFGLYFPGSFIIALAVFLSDGSFTSLILISLVVAITLTLNSLINYFIGRQIPSKTKIINKYKDSVGKGLFLSMIHPNILAFYFFHQGIEKRKLWKIFWVPVIMLPYGLTLAYILSLISGFAKQQIENPLFMFILIFIWLIISFIISHRRKIKRLIEIEKSLK